MAAIPAPIKEEALPHGELDLYAGVDEFGNPANPVRMKLKGLKRKAKKCPKNGSHFEILKPTFH